MPFLTPSETPVARVCRRLFIPDSPDWLAVVNGALSELIRTENWESFGAVTPVEAAAVAQQMVLDFLESGCMIGTIHPYVTSSPPPGCLPCDGGLYAREAYPRLYEALPPALIVDADTFRTPDLRNRFIYGAGGNYALLAIGGSETVALSPEQNGRHAHATLAHAHVDAGHAHLRPNSPGVSISVAGPGELVALAPSLIPGSTTTGYAALQPETVTVLESGDGAPHDNMPPFVALNYCIVAR